MNKDQYNTEPTPEELREAWEAQRYQKTQRVTKLIAPLSSETLQIYVERLEQTMIELEEQAIREHMYGKKGAWYVHKRPQNCFICDLITMDNQMLNILRDVITLSPKQLAKHTFNHEKRLANDAKHK